MNMQKLCFSLVLLALVAETAVAQQQLRGRVVATANQQPLPGVGITVRGSSQRTATDAQGNFSISAELPAVLVFSYVGYAERELPVSTAGSSLLIMMEVTASQLDEVIVVGYGTQRKSDVSGAVVSVKPEQLNTFPTVSVSELLRGKAAGVRVTTSSSRPGGSSDILIRGQRSLSGGNGPLYVVDNVPVNNIDDLNAADIASLEILKDASSQAIYGARAANGVILITTKRGSTGRAEVTYGGYAGVQSLKKNFDLYTGEEWADLRREAFRAENAQGEYESDEVVFDEVMRRVLANGTAVDWEDFMLRNTWMQKHDISFRGGSEKTRVAGTAGYFKQDGMVEGSDFERGTARLNVDQQLSRFVDIGANLAFTKYLRNQEDGDFNSYLTTQPLAEPFDADGNLQLLINGEAQTNPKFLNEQTYNQTRSERLLFNFFGNVKLYKGLQYRMNTSINTRNNEGAQYRSMLYEKGSNQGNYARIADGKYMDYMIENILSYDNTLNDVNRFDVTLMQSYYKEENKTLVNSGTRLPNDFLGHNGLPAAEVLAAPERTVSDRALISYMGRLRYYLMDRYLFTATTRIDGSTVFGANNKFGIFPSAAFAWRMEQEEFMEPVEWVSQLKWRINYGEVGNQAVSPYTTLGNVNDYQMLFGDGSYQTGYLAASELSNPNLKWETTLSLNLGVDYELFDGRIGGAFEYYKTNTRDLLVRKSINEALGYSSMLINLGEVQNKGFEATLTTMPVRKNDFTWTVDLNFSVNRNKILRINDMLDENGDPVNDLNNSWFIGQPISVYYDYLFDGIWQLDDDMEGSVQPQALPGDVRVVDRTGDGLIDQDDRGIIQRDPKWIGAFNTAVRYKGIDVSAEFYTVQGGFRRNPYLYSFNEGGSLSGKTNGLKVDYWTPENPSNTAPRPRFNGSPQYFSSIGYQDASYVMLRALTLGYTLPKHLASYARLGNARLYVTANNMFSRTGFQSYGPEVTPGAYPEPRTVIFGLNVTL